MVREICKDEAFLSQKAQNATATDREIEQDLRDTLTAHADECVGMAANMIGINKRVIIFEEQGQYSVLFNPHIVKASGEFTTEEGCLSLTGKRFAKRYHSIKVAYQDDEMKPHFKTYTGFTAQIVQHELDHCEGVII